MWTFWLRKRRGVERADSVMSSPVFSKSCQRRLVQKELTLPQSGLRSRKRGWLWHWTLVDRTVWSVFSSAHNCQFFTNFIWLFHYLFFLKEIHFPESTQVAPCLRQIVLGERSMKEALVLPDRGKERTQTATRVWNCTFDFRSVSVWKPLIKTWCFVPKLTHYFLYK